MKGLATSLDRAVLAFACRAVGGPEAPVGGTTAQVAVMASDAAAPTADAVTLAMTQAAAAPAAAAPSSAAPSASSPLPKLEPFRLRTPLPAAYLLRDFISPADEVRTGPAEAR